MKVVFQALVGVMVTAVPALAEQKVFGEAEVAYGQTDLEDLDDTADHLNLGGKAAFVSSAGLGIQLGASYSNLSVKGLARLTSIPMTLMSTEMPETIRLGHS